MLPQVLEYISQSKQWQEELSLLRELVVSAGLTEEFKWRAPCYTHQGKNIVMLGALKNSCTLSFFQGALLDDPQGLLQKPGPNCRATRVLRFTSVKEITPLKAKLRGFLKQAKQLEEAGQRVDFAQDREVEMPAEFAQLLDESAELQAAFHGLTPGRQRAYLLYFAAAKQSKTRVARVEKYRQQILDGKGLNDCTCGLSKRMPGCDGSHKDAQ